MLNDLKYFKRISISKGILEEVWNVALLSPACRVGCRIIGQASIWSDLSIDIDHPSKWSDLSIDIDPSSIWSDLSIDIDPTSIYSDLSIGIDHASIWSDQAFILIITHGVI